MTSSPLITRRGFVASGLGAAAAGVIVAAGGSKTAQAQKNEPNQWRVFDAPTGKEEKWCDWGSRLAGVGVLFVGEQHDDPGTHRAEAALLTAAYQKAGKNLTFALEMFERDQQGPLNDYLAGKTSEAEFAKRVKLWPNYATDYRPLIEFAKAQGIPVVASNAPARLVRRVGKEGLAPVLASLSVEDKPLIAAQIHAPPLNTGDENARRFAGVMGQGGHGETGTGAMPAEMVQKFYEAQCVRDDTMAESVARLVDAGRTVFHLSGGFHVAGGLGTVQRLLWRRPLQARAVCVVQIVPVKGKPDPAQNKNEADYLVCVSDTRPATKEQP